MGGLILTLLQNSPLKTKIVCGLQIIYCKERNYWVVALGLGFYHNPIKVYDSLFMSVDKETKQVILNMFKKVGKIKIDSVDIPVQRDGTECGIFTIAIATSFAFENDPANITFQQDTMRDHLLNQED